MLEVEVIKFNLDEVLENIASLFGSRARDKKIELSVGATSAVPVILLGDPLRLTQVLTNLVGNAIKFTERGEVSLFVEISTNENNRVQLVFSVKDSGIGMTQQQQDALFKPFTQADSSITRKYGGSGLGLVISQQLVNLMGGTILVESEFGVGSNISFIADFGIENGVVSASKSLAGKKVLVVDDSATMRKLLVGHLRNLECDIEEADSGETVLTKLQTGFSADCIIMDWHMPGMNGIEVARHLREHSQPVPILLITADDIELAQFEANTLVQLIISKPVSSSQLYKSLAILFGEQLIAPNEQVDQVIIPDLTGQRILLVDDNEFNREVGSELVSLTKAVVDTANNGQQAVEAVSDNAASGGNSKAAYDLILMDIHMPIMDGYAAAKIIHAKYPELPIVALTADAVTTKHQQFEEAGVADILTKPIQSAELYKILARLQVNKLSGPNAQNNVVTQKDETRDAQNPQHNPESKGADIFSKLPGFDTQAALARLSGDISLYRHFLIMFRERNASALHNFNLALERQDINSAKRLIHSLKGSTATIGAINLSAVAAQIEQELAKSEDSKDSIFSELMKRLSIEWDAAMAIIETVTKET